MIVFIVVDIEDEIRLPNNRIRGKRKFSVKTASEQARQSTAS